jgi:hypothetical protein
MLSEARASPSAASASLSEELPLPVEVPEAGVVLEERTLRKSRLLPYVRMVVNLIEGVQLGPEEVVSRLLRDLRQHRMGRRKRGEYVGEHLVPDRP